MTTGPAFPPKAVAARAVSLGYGTTWDRKALVERLGEANADKFVQTGREYGWLINPKRGVYLVPSAQDLAIVPWLEPVQRRELVTARALSTLGIRYWCLSAWLRTIGIDLGRPVLVTDLATLPTKGRYKRPNMKAIRERNQRAAAELDNFPFLDELIIVPEMPQANQRQVSPDELVKGTGPVSARTATLAIGATGAVITDKPQALRPEERAIAMARLDYTLSPPVEDPTWVLALIASLGIARIDERFDDILTSFGVTDDRRNTSDNLQRTATWAHLIGPPRPNDDWQRIIRSGTFPYLLLPEALWTEIGADQAARRQNALARMGVKP